MKVNDVKVFFRYEENGTIKAIAKNVQTDEEVASREVKLRHDDRPDKKIGRAYAFKKLIIFMRSNNFITSKERKEFWKQFGSQCKQPKVKLAY